MLPSLSSPSSLSNHANAKILNRIRLIAINGQILLILFSVIYLDIYLPTEWIVGIIGFEIGFQIFSYWRVKQPQIISSKTLLSHLLIDSLILSSLVYFAGGAHNPFIYLLLLPIALGTLMLKPYELLFICAIQLILYSAINLYPRPLELGETSPLNSFHLHLTGMWINFILTVTLMGVFGLLSRHTMLQQEKKLQQLREKQLKDEQLLSLGIVSASAAHELGTPLATMAVIIDDLKHEEVPETFKQDLDILSNQIDASRNIIQSLSHKSQHTQNQLSSNQLNAKNIKLSLTNLFENWLVYRPKIVLKTNWNNQVEVLDIALPLSVEQALTNLLDNAADAGLENNSDSIEINVSHNAHEFIIEILDNGKGISKELQSSTGVSLTKTNKKDGLGWGLFLSNASLERVGGNVELSNRENGGTQTKIILPKNQ